MLQHVNTSRECRCERCVSLRMRESPDWLLAWDASYIVDDSLTFDERLRLAEALYQKAKAEKPTPTDLN